MAVVVVLLASLVAGRQQRLGLIRGRNGDHAPRHSRSTARSRWPRTCS